MPMMLTVLRRLMGGMALGILAIGSVAAAPELRAFPTPDAAVDALIAALQAPTLDPLMEIFDRQVLENVPPEERRSDAARRAAGARLANEPRKIVYEGDDKKRARVIVGKEDFVLPTPLVKTDRGWVFDGEAGIAAMNERRIGVNEANAIRALRALARAQEIYREQDRDGDGILQYAQHIRGTEGRLDGLVNTVPDEAPGPPTSLLNEAFARAEGKPGDPDHHPLGGYGYAILTAQGPNADGGARSYLVNGHLVDGYAVIAWPTRPGQTGESVFIMNQTGQIYEQEFGDTMFERVSQITAFDPDENWSPVEDE